MPSTASRICKRNKREQLPDWVDVQVFRVFAGYPGFIVGLVVRWLNLNLYLNSMYLFQLIQDVNKTMQFKVMNTPVEDGTFKFDCVFSLKRALYPENTVALLMSTHSNCFCVN